jgi:hypothetical protein
MNLLLPDHNWQVEELALNDRIYLRRLAWLYNEQVLHINKIQFNIMLIIRVMFVILIYICKP